MEIIEGIHQVDGVNANTYVMIDGKELTVIDTGMPENSEKILNHIHKIGRQSSGVSTILLTHYHMDHIGSAYELRKLTNARVAVHEDDALFVAGTKAPPRPKNLVLRAFSFFIRSAPTQGFTPVQPDITLRGNDRIGRLVVIHTPGHTPGSISLYEPESKVLFVGDAIMCIDGKIAPPPGQFTQDMTKAIQSIQKISKLDFRVMLSGHGEPLKPNASDKVKEFCSSMK